MRRRGNAEQTLDQENSSHDSSSGGSAGSAPGGLAGTLHRMSSTLMVKIPQKSSLICFPLQASALDVLPCMPVLFRVMLLYTQGVLVSCLWVHSLLGVLF